MLFAENLFLYSFVLPFPVIVLAAIAIARVNDLAAGLERLEKALDDSGIAGGTAADAPRGESR